MKNGKFVNLFNPSDMKSDFLSVVGYGAIMGMLKHYEVMNLRFGNDRLPEPLETGF